MMPADESDLQKSPIKQTAQKGSITINNLTGDNLWKDIPLGKTRMAVEETSGEKKNRKLKRWLPPMDNSFWELYANKLRVNAADSGVCDLASIE